MGVMKELWMAEIERISERYSQERGLGRDAKESFEKNLQELTLHGLTTAEATAELEAAWFDPPSDPDTNQE